MWPLEWLVTLTDNTNFPPAIKTSILRIINKGYLDALGGFFKLELAYKSTIYLLINIISYNLIVNIKQLWIKG